MILSGIMACFRACRPQAGPRTLPSGYLLGAGFRGAIVSSGHSKSRMGERMGRMFGFLGAVIALAAGMYVYAKQAQSSSAAAGASNPKAAINITGVKGDLLGIASAERQYYVSEGKYASFDELISNHYITVARQRPPYSYEVETSETGFRVVATRSGDNSSGTPGQISVDETMEFKISE